MNDGLNTPEAMLPTAAEGYRTLIEQIPAVTHLSRLDPLASTIYISPQVEEMTGFAPVEWIADPDLWVKLLHPDDRARMAEANARHIRAGRPISEEYRIVGRDGRIVWIKEESRILRDDRGQPVASQGILLDITDLKETEQALRESEQRYRALVDASPDAIVVADLTAKILLANRRAAEMVGFGDPQEMIGHDVNQSLVPEDRGAARQNRQQLLEQGLVQGLAYTVLRRDGSCMPAEVSASLLRDESDEPFGSISIVRDVTERARVHEYLQLQNEVLRESEQRRRRLFSRLMQTQEDERRRIAWDLHDDPLQKLSAMVLRLDQLQRAIHDGSARRLVEDLTDMAHASIGSIRDLLFELRPPVLDEPDGLLRTIGLRLDRLRERAGTAFELVDKVVEELPPETRSTCYRIVLEALANIERHANADHATVRLESAAHGVYGSIHDDGQGFEMTRKTVPGHLGLASMKERAELAGGAFRVESAPGQGTKIEFWLPGA